MKKLLLKSILLLCALITGTSAWATDYVKITSTSELVAGGEYLIVNTAGTYAAGATSTTSTKYATTVGVTVSSNKITDPNANVAVYTLGGNSAGWTFYSSKDSKYLYWTSGNSLNVNATVSNNTKWTVSISDGAATIANVATTDRVIRFNSDRFACYTTNTGTLVSIYKKQTAAVAVTGVSLPSTAKAFIGKKITLTPTFTPSEATNKNVTWVSKNPSIATVSDAGVVTGVAEGTADIEVTTADGGFKATCEVTVETYHVDLTSPVAITNWPSLSYGDAADYEVGGITFTATQCYKNSGLQFKKNEGILASPLITTSNGYTVIVTTNSAGSGTLTLQIGSETPVSITSGNSSMYSAKTSSTSTSFTLTNSSGNACNIATLTIIPNSAEVQSYGWATYIAPAAIQFAENTAYVVTAASLSGLTLAAVTQVPAGTPVLLKGAGNKDITVIASASAPATNLLEVSDGSALASGSYPYVLAKNGEGACFKQWTGAMSVLNGRVMLVLDEAVAARGIFELDDNEITGVNEVKTQKADGQYFNLAGQRVAQPTKGLYIVNGKKVMVK